MRSRTDHGIPLLASFALAVVTSGGILAERMSGGAPSIAVLASLFATVACLLIAAAGDSTLAAEKPIELLAAQFVGGFAGIAAVHASIAWFGSMPWLEEGPRQLVNDAVALATLLAAIWTFGRRSGLGTLALGVGVAFAYRMSAPLWHIDQPPNGFQATVQQCVVAQFGAVALALAVFRRLSESEPGI